MRKDPDQPALSGGAKSVLRVPRAPSIQGIPTLKSKVCKYYLLWGLFGALGRRDLLTGQFQSRGLASVRGRGSHDVRKLLWTCSRTQRVLSTYIVQSRGFYNRNDYYG